MGPFHCKTSQSLLASHHCIGAPSLPEVSMNAQAVLLRYSPRAHAQLRSRQSLHNNVFLPILNEHRPVVVTRYSLSGGDLFSWNSCFYDPVDRGKRVWLWGCSAMADSTTGFAGVFVVELTQSDCAGAGFCKVHFQSSIRVVPQPAIY